MSFVTKRVDTLNRSYKRALKISFIIVLLLVIAAFKFAPQNTVTQQIKPADENISVIPDVNPTNQQIQPPPEQVDDGQAGEADDQDLDGVGPVNPPQPA